MNSTLVSPIHGMGFVPGVVRGKLSRNPATNGILLANHKILQGMSGSPAGCVLLECAPFSHASIGLLSRGIPTVIVGTDDAVQLHEGLEVILDGACGRVLPLEADDRDLTTFPPPVPCNLRTLDGERVDIRASVRSVAGVHLAREHGVEAIGLVRTEFLVPDGGVMPDQAFYAEAFEAVLEAAHPLPVTFRLLDLAADKHPRWASALPDTGPLGLHGSRLYRHPVVRSIVEAQLQALRPLGQRFTFGLLLPNMDSVEQFEHRRSSMHAALSDRGIKVGAMLETASATLTVEEFLATADLVGFGLNDLMQSPYRGLFPSPPLFDRMPTYRTQGKRSLNFLSAGSHMGSGTGVRR
jgi:phosphoenolpyruvate-protein kinase (PTS system EI component)